MKYEVTRQEILDAASTMLGLPFVHQGRSGETGVDCVGLLVVMGEKIKYPQIFDVAEYRRIPSSTVIKETLMKNMDEIPLEDAKPGDVFLMKQGGLLARHAAIYYSEELDVENGKQPMILHAVKEGVRIQPIADFPSSWFVSAFRLRGVKD